MEKNKVSVKMAKRIAILLSEVWKNKEFVVEIMNALEKHPEEYNDFILFLEKGTELVPSEIYEKVTEITGGTFVKEFSEVCVAKKRCIDNPSDENWIVLFDALDNAQLVFVCEWNLNGKEKNILEKSKVDDIVCIETEIKPIIFEDEESRKAIIPVYSSIYELRRDFYGEGYAMKNTSWSNAIHLFNSCREVLGDAAIVLDIDSDKCLEIRKEHIDKYWKRT